MGETLNDPPACDCGEAIFSAGGHSASCAFAQWHKKRLTAEVVDGKIVWNKGKALADAMVAAGNEVFGESKVEPPKECKGKAAARALAVMVLSPEIGRYLRENDPKVMEQALKSLEPFGYPDLEVLGKKLGL